MAMCIQARVCLWVCVVHHIWSHTVAPCDLWLSGGGGVTERVEMDPRRPERRERAAA